jgi:hypothetical protein
MRSRFKSELGAVAAEFAVALPAVVLVLALAIGSIGLGAEELRLQGAAFEAARLLGRGDPGARARIRSVSQDATLSTFASGESICAEARVSVALGMLSGISLSATSCALNDAQS